MSLNGIRRKSTVGTLSSHGDDTSRSVQNASSIAEIRATLAQLKEQETNVTSRLNELISSQRELSRELGKLDIIRAQLGSQAVATRSISNNMLNDAATTAKRISGAVQKLDLEQDRVKATLQVVEQVSELKACVHGVVGSMGAPQDWETAAGYLNRASKIPKEIVQGSFAEEIVPSIEVPDPPSVTLEHASESLCSLFLREFEKATKEDNGAKVTRFFKLFPLIGRSDVGLGVYGRYVCQGVASHARENLNAGTGGTQRKNGFFYANALRKLFEYVAQIVERHGGLVERHYGEGQMVKVIERLQMEADVQGGIVIDSWSEERGIDRKLTDIRSYAFTFLVQSFLPTQSSRNPILRSGSPATFDRETPQVEDDSVDMKEVDGFLGEIGVMLARWSLYTRFIATKCADPRIPVDESSPLTVPTSLSNSALMRKVNDKLTTPFNQMSTFYFRRSVEKAFQLDEQPQDLTLNMSKSLTANSPFITSAVDDVMYIVNQVLQRTLSTSQRSVIASVLPTISRVLCSDYIGMIQRKMRDESYPKPAIQGGLPPEHTIVAFLVLLNNLDVSTDYIKRIVSSKLDTTLDSPATNSTTDVPTAPLTSPTTPSTPPPPPSKPILSAFPFAHDAPFVASALHTLHTTFYSKTAELLADGIFVIFRNVMRPRLRPVITDTFRDMDYGLSADELDELNRLAAEHDENGPEAAAATASRGGGGGMLQAPTDSAGRPLAVADAVAARFQAGWDALTRPLRRILTEPNWERLLGVVASYLGSEVLEKRLWGYYGRVNALGAARLERDMAGIVGVVVKSGQRYALRDAFARCGQICLVANMEEEEWEEVRGPEGGAGEVEWRIDEEERVRARGLVNG